MSEMIERVARGIADHICISEHWESQIPLARAAIEAMRDVPQGMVDAGNSALSSNGVDNVEDDDAAMCWQAMIEFALSQDTPSLPTPAATPTDSANPPPVESVGPNSEVQS